MAEGKRVSMNPDNFVEGGLIDDFDGEVMMAKFCYWDYDKGGEQYLFLGLVIKNLADSKEFPQYYSAGDKEMFEPGDEEGTWLKAKSDRGAMSTSTNAAALLKSLQAANFPQQRLEEMGIGEALVGLKAHWNRVTQPKRPGLIKTGKAADGKDEREKSTLLVSSILSLPGQVGGGVATKKAGLGIGATSPAKTAVGVAAGKTVQSATPAPTNGAAAVADPEIDDLCMMTLMEILAENGGTVTKAQLPAMAFKKLMQNPLKAKAIPRIHSIPFLESVTAAGITFDGATVTMQ